VKRCESRAFSTLIVPLALLQVVVNGMTVLNPGVITPGEGNTWVYWWVLRRGVGRCEEVWGDVKRCEER
jgi:hypothetical protein